MRLRRRRFALRRDAHAPSLALAPEVMRPRYSPGQQPGASCHAHIIPGAQTRGDAVVGSHCNRFGNNRSGATGGAGAIIIDELSVGALLAMYLVTIDA